MIRISLTAPKNGEVISQHTHEQQLFAVSKQDSPSGQKIDWLNLVRDDRADRTQPQEIAFSWKIEGQDRGRAELQCAEDPAFTCGLMCFPADISNTAANAHSLKINTVYYWRVVWTTASGKDVVSASRVFRTADELPRWIKVGGISNVRDCGGWRTKYGKRVRQGLFFRGGELNVHMNITPDGIRFLDRQLRMRTDMDLRREVEVAELAGHESPLPPHIRWVNVPILAYADCFPEDMRRIYADAFRLLINKVNLPVYAHCWGGADRTGTLVLLINAVLGVDDESLLLDYEMTSLAIWGERRRDTDYFAPFLLELNSFAPRKSLEEQAVAYFKSCGITDEEIGKLKSVF